MKLENNSPNGVFTFDGFWGQNHDKYLLWNACCLPMSFCFFSDTDRSSVRVTAVLGSIWSGWDMAPRSFGTASAQTLTISTIIPLLVVVLIYVGVAWITVLCQAGIWLGLVPFQLTAFQEDQLHSCSNSKWANVWPKGLAPQFCWVPGECDQLGLISASYPSSEWCRAYNNIGGKLILGFLKKKLYNKAQRRKRVLPFIFPWANILHVSFILFSEPSNLLHTL